MKKIFQLMPNNHETLLDIAAKNLSQGRIVAVPTDTIYGIAGLVQNNDSIQRIYGIKGRNLKKPLAICVGDLLDVERWGRLTIPKQLLQELLPGPVTVVLQRSEQLNRNLNPDTQLIGIRIPDYGFLRQLCRHCDGPVALTSANRSNSASSLSITEFKDLWPSLDMIVDAGRLAQNDDTKDGSTVVNLSEPGLFGIIRKGCAYEDTVSKLLKYSLVESSEGT